jgi:Protein of unknown function (DUF1549)/Protein of unknown function (DUF1553)/Planctomycete cytochrome C
MPLPRRFLCLQSAALHCFVATAFSCLTSALAFGQIDFSHEIVPILRKHCAECHAGDNKKGGFSFNDRTAMLAGGESGKVIEPGNANASYLLELVQSSDEDTRMPPKGERVNANEMLLLRKWIDEGLKWDEGFAFKKPPYESKLELVNRELPSPTDGRIHPVDRIIDHYQIRNSIARPKPINDAEFLRRSSLDLIGKLPEPSAIELFYRKTDPNRRQQWIDALLNDQIGYADHWLTFWNDLLRNDYGGTGFITGGRKQISRWLYQSLIENKPYDQFVRELINPPNEDSSGFISGIQWRGDVSAAQKVEIQFAQSISQSFLGINMKCASCHDSFIDRWTLKEAYGLAAIYSDKPLEIYRCDKVTGAKAEPAWIFPELGEIDPNAKKPERLKQLSYLMTDKKNGRFARTIANRLWHRLMGRGIVHPVDAMQSEPWSEELLDHLAISLIEQKYDLRNLLRYIASSVAYQSQTITLDEGSDGRDYKYSGPMAKRLTAEQFVDAVWTITDSAPNSFNAPIFRGVIDPELLAKQRVSANWIWGEMEEAKEKEQSERSLLFQKSFKLDEVPDAAGVLITVNREYALFVNNRVVASDSDFRTLEMHPIQNLLRKGNNTISVVAGGPTNSPEKGSVIVEARIRLANQIPLVIKSDESWRYAPSSSKIKDKRLKAIDPKLFKDVMVVKTTPSLKTMTDTQGPLLLARAISTDNRPARASLMKSSFLMRALGRPNREQIVSMRPNELTTLEAIDLSNGQEFADFLVAGAKKWSNAYPRDSKALILGLYLQALTREPTTEEMAIGLAILGEEPELQSIEDLLWTVMMLPEFQFVR